MSTSSSRKWAALAVGATTLAAACADPTGSSADSALAAAALSASLSTVPVGYGELASSYVGVSASGVPTSGNLWLAGGREASFDRGGLMGGGLGDAFTGGVEFGRGGPGRGPFGGGFAGALGCTGATFSATTGRVTCPTETRNGLTIVRSAAYATAAGVVQQAFDTLTTDKVNTRTEISGTVGYTRDSASASRGPGDGRGHGPGLGGPGGRLLGDTATILTATTTVKSTSDRTVSGLAPGSANRTTNGTSAGTETTTGTSSRGAFTASRTAGDTTKGLVIRNRVAGDTTKAYPTAGTVIRAMSATLTFAGKAATTVSRREVVTYDGSATAKVTITENGTTKSCTRPLPRGRLTCS